MPTWVCTQASAQRSPVPSRLDRVQGCAPNPNRPRQGQEPLAQRRRSLRCAAPLLRSERDELLHRYVRRVPCPRSVVFIDLGSCSWSANRATKVLLHTCPQEIGRCQVKCIKQSSLSVQQTHTHTQKHNYTIDDTTLASMHVLPLVNTVISLFYFDPMSRDHRRYRSEHPPHWHNQFKKNPKSCFALAILCASTPQNLVCVSHFRPRPKTTHQQWLEFNLSICTSVLTNFIKYLK